MENYAFNSYYSSCKIPCKTTKIRSSYQVKNKDDLCTQIRLYFNPEETIIKNIKKIQVFDIFIVFGNAGGLWLGVFILTMFDMVKMVTANLKVRFTGLQQFQTNGIKMVTVVLELITIIFFASFTYVFISRLKKSTSN